MPKRPAGKSDDRLTEWQATCDERSFRLLLMVCLLAAVYLYAGIISPRLAKRESGSLKALRGQIERLVPQFEDLGRRYSEFLTREADASVQDSSLSIRMFQDTIIPLATQAAASPKATPVQGDASKIVWNLNSAFSKLYRLNDDYQREPGPQQEAMIGSLECLASLEEAIFLLREVEELEGRCDFSDLLSSAMASQRNTTNDWHPPAGLLVAYGPYYRALNGYTPLMRAGPTGADTVRGYVAIVSQVAPSFPVKTVADLKKLQEFLDQRSAQIVSEYTPLSVDLPLLGTKVSRNILLWVGPLMILLLLHMVGF